MNTYRIEVKTTNGWKKFGCTPIAAQVEVIKYRLKEQGKEVRVVKNGVVVDGGEN